MKRIMIVDNEADFCYFVKQNLEATGEFEVNVCSQSDRALDETRQFHPDLILLDILMPGLPGLDVAARLRKDHETRKIPVVFLTVAATAEETRGGDCFIEGNRVLSKPVEIGKLIETIESVAA